ncbi:hypothetical protein ELE36_16615 [Pseudolysobacter antarcticus]|uniref:DUF2029 domain-containing protein n=1 Tax=Pseudolysobacter antarcticus TaxID=2511995 RepID=A0A411HMZ5_9GAMM|nr:hypothetical protein [Pseudolysobacter antarcticus]QBB71846.1 hypothetical protein ELE36_16615 [Pseudolysobacter antarcticus]
MILDVRSQSTADLEIRKNSIRIGFLLAVLTIAVLVFRRPDQFSNPYIWVEDGTTILNQYIEHGWLTLFYPVNGYFITPTKIIHTLSLALSFRWFPEISYWLTMLFTISVIWAIALCPTQLRHKTWCAVSVLFIPTGSEVFAVSEYALWWGGLLLFLPLLWEKNDEKLSARLFLIVFGGLSSPLVIFLSPIYLLRTFFTRARVDNVIAGAVILVAGIQAAAIHFSRQSPQWDKLSFSLPLLAGKFFGWFEYWSLDPAMTPMIAGAAILLGLVLLVCCWPKLRRYDFVMVLLCIALPLCILSAILRAPLPAIDPYITAPRYFFYPFILISWILIQSLNSNQPLRYFFVLAALASAWINFLLFAPWHHSFMDWRKQVIECLAQPEFTFQIHFQGRADSQWGERLTNEQCKTLVESSLFNGKN